MKGVNTWLLIYYGGRYEIESKCLDKEMKLVAYGANIMERKKTNKQTSREETPTLSYTMTENTIFRSLTRRLSS